MEILDFQASSSYGYVRATPLALANALNTELEQWFQNCKYLQIAIPSLTEEKYSQPLQLEYTYSRRNKPIRSYECVQQDVTNEVNLLSYHQIVKIIHSHIELSYKILISLSSPKSGDSIFDFKTQIEQKCVSFHKKTFPDKLRKLSASLNLTTQLNPLIQINKIRNCLEHRGGRVTEQDCDSGKTYMSMEWRYPKVTSSSGDISPITDTKGNINASVGFVNEIKKFKKGSRITFDFYDNSKCIHTINSCFKPIIDGIYNLKQVDQSQHETLIREF